ncbi:MAG: hypothetical protein KGZ60_06590 [Truepera sp.]|nr:hypothetical protein [Truepera sp.]
MKAIRYRVTLLEPTLIASFGGAPDSVESFDYLPGSVLRGIFIGNYMRQYTLRELDATDATVRRLFFDGSTRFLNGYPLDRTHPGKRMLPTPHSWRNKKGDETAVFDLAVDDEISKDEELKPVNKPFCLVSEKVQLHRPEKLLTIHTRRTRRFGRAVSGAKLKLEADDIEGAIYRYEALQAGQHFEAIILCDQDEDADALSQFVSGAVLLGKSRSGGYGRACIEICEIEEDDWFEASYDVHQSPLIVTLLSDTLIRDDAGQYTTDVKVVERLLAQKLDIELSLHDAFVKTQIIGGFNRKWGLPLPQTQALQAGSVLVFDTDETPDEDRLTQLLWQGIGERRAEGFGRVAVNWQALEELKVTDNDGKNGYEKNRNIASDEGKEIAGRMLHRMLGEQVEAAIMQSADRFGHQIRNPSKSQFNGLRMVIQRALRQPPDEGRRAIANYLDSLEGRKSTREQFSRDRVAGKDILEWIRERATDEHIWQELDIGKLPQLGDLQAKLDAAQAYNYNLRLVDAVLARAAKSKGGNE